MANKKEFVTKLTRMFNKTAFKLQKHSPEILVVSGIVGLVGSAVIACKATTKINEITESAHEELDKIRDAGERIEAGETLKLKDGSEYTAETNRRDLTIVYAQTAVKFVKLYAPAVILGGLSITAILAGHNITRKRNVALAAAYAAVDKSFKEYRSRVIDRFGEALDKELLYNVRSEEITEKKDNEDGTVTEETKMANIVDHDLNSPYAKFFDEGCEGWTKDPDYNMMFLKDQQRYANDMLQAKGHLFLNEVYDLLGIQRTKAGQVVGWVYDEKNPVGDNFVDFGIYDFTRSKKVCDFVNGYENVILLDFNVDGNIMDLMP